MFFDQSTDNFLGNTLGAELLSCKLIDSTPNPEITTICTFVSWNSYIKQLNIMIQTLS